MWKIFILVSFVIFCLGIGAGIVFDKKFLMTTTPSLYSETAREVRQGGYKYINPLLECEVAGDRINVTRTNFKYKIEDYVNSTLEKGVIDDIAIYYRDLNNGPWFGFNEKTQFTPASLLKVPLMIAHLKKAEGDPSYLSTKIPFEGDDFEELVEQNTTPTQTLEQGKTYTIEQLLKIMIRYSDNHAMNLLLENLDDQIYKSVYQDLGISVSEVRTPDDFMTVRDYASFFRILFNASYLDVALSEKAIEMMTHSDYTKALRAGVPISIPVAHKFGERSLNDIAKKQLHDCGIVYYPNHPYLLCIMTRGENYEILSSVIKEVSQRVFKEVDANFR